MAKFSEKKMIQDIRMLSLDMIDEAKSGHPGIALGAAPIMYTLFAKHLRFDLTNPNWFNRDRFILSAGHGSSLLYATLFCTTGEYDINDLKNFRTLYSKTPGHPELDVNKRIECSTGPLGQGLATSVGIAVAGKYLTTFNTKKEILFDYDVYVLCGDGDLMEGISYEAASLAGSLNLDNLIVLYDANQTTLDGNLSKNYKENIKDMYVALDWEVIEVKNGESVKEIDKAINKAKKSDSPALIIINTTIGKYSKYEGTNLIHGKLEAEDLQEIRAKLKREQPFTYDKVNLALYRQNIKERTEGYYSDWCVDYECFMKNIDSKTKDKLNSILMDEEVSLRLDKIIDTSKLFVDKTLLDVNYQIMNVISAFVPSFLGGSADVVKSTKTYLKGKNDFSLANYSGRNIAFGVREHTMGAILNGLALTNFRPFGSCFLAFSDYLKPAIRMSALMNLPVTYVFSHDSILNGQDGPTHQPIEQLAMLRTIPNFSVYRPCDYKELLASWNLILNDKKPCALILPRNHVETLETTTVDSAMHGAYIVSEAEEHIELIIIATGSEVELALRIKEELKRYISIRVVSMPNIKTFLNQEIEYQEEILPKETNRIVIEFSNDPTWYQFIPDKNHFFGPETFGASATKEDLLKSLELDLTSLVIKIKELI